MISQISRRVKILAEGFDALELARTKFDAIGIDDAVEIIEKAMIDIHNLIFGKPIEREEPELKTLEEVAEDNLIWIEINERVRYAYDEKNDEFILQHKKAGEGYKTLKKWKFEDLKKIFDALPDRATVDDIREIAKAIGVSTGNMENYLIRVFTHIKFGCDLTTQQTGGHPKLLLIKNPEGDFSLAEENRRRLEQEREVIGNMYSP